MQASPIKRRTFVARFTTLAAAAALAAGVPSLAAAADGKRPNAVVHWNGIAADAFAPSQGTNPMAQSRTFAILHASVHDALNAIQRRYAAHTPGLAAAPKASPEAAVAAAARGVLVALVPEQAARVEAAYAEAIAALPEGAARSAGIALGEAAARATLERRRTDRADAAAEKYLPRDAAGEYRFTAPFDFAGMPGWGKVQPFAIVLERHGVKPPLPLAGAAYAGDVAEVRAIGAERSTTRTAEQTEIAKFWYEDSPLGWNRIASSVVRDKNADAWDAARAFALVHFAMADGFIAGFHAKYEHRFWRPITAIHAAASDGNPRTEADATWQPLLVTPPVPDHPSTHTVLGWAAAQVLIDLYGDDVRYEMTSLTLPGVTRRYRGFSTAAQENGMSRLYAGIHFRHAIDEGKRQGRGIGRAVGKSLAAAD